MTNRDDLTPPTPAGWQPAQLSRLRCAELNRSCRYAPVRRVTLTLTSKSSHPLEALRRTRTLIPCARKIAAKRTSVVRFPSRGSAPSPPTASPSSRCRPSAASSPLTPPPQGRAQATGEPAAPRSRPSPAPASTP